MHVFFSDLDGTLLDSQTYSWEAARPAVERLRQLDIPCILVSSKTKAEIEHFRAEMQNCHPFIVENGGAAYIPRGYFPIPVTAAVSREEYDVLEWGTHYPRLVEALRNASLAAECPVRGFSQMSVEEIARESGLPPELARRARQREYDEPFVILDRARAGYLLAALDQAGQRWTFGGRYHHVCGKNDKAIAVQAIQQLFLQTHGSISTVGLGDEVNDAGFLQTVDLAFIIRSARALALRARLPFAQISASPGPLGWNEVVHALLETPARRAAHR